MNPAAIESTRPRGKDAATDGEALRTHLHGMWASVAGAWEANAAYTDARGAAVSARMLELTAPGPAPVQVAATAALNGSEDCIKEMRATYKLRRDVLVESFSRAGWQVPSPRASMFAGPPFPSRSRVSAAWNFPNCWWRRPISLLAGYRFRRIRRGLRAHCTRGK